MQQLIAFVITWKSLRIGGCGAMFEIHIKSADFRNLSMVKQHQMVNTALKEEVKQMHGLRIFTETS